MGSVAVRPGVLPDISSPSGVKVWHYRDLDGELIARVYTHADSADLPGFYGEIGGDQPRVGLNGLLLGPSLITVDAGAEVLTVRGAAALAVEARLSARAEIERQIEAHLAPFGWVFVWREEAAAAKYLEDRAIADAQRLAIFSLRIGVSPGGATVYAADCVVLPSENDHVTLRLAATLRAYADRLDAERSANIAMGEVYKTPRGSAP